MSPSPYCSRAAPEEPIAGTAPAETHWLFAEAPGSWGRDALASSSLSASQRAELASLPSTWRVVLVRRPDRPLRGLTDRMLWLSTPDRVARWRLAPDEPLHPDRLGTGDPVAADALFVCTNGRRDRCCALFGRAVFDALASPVTWECSHLGGHRFAPTAVRLSDRLVFGRMDAAAAVSVLDGKTPLDHVRGPAGWPPPVQVAAVSAWRHNRRVVPVRSAQEGRAGGITVTLRDGGVYDVQLERVELADRMLSCGAAPTPGFGWRATAVSRR